MPNISPRILELENLIKQELQGLQLGRHVKETIFGAIDVPLFSIRFRITEPNALEDQGWVVIIIPNKDKFSPNKIFLALAERGYLHYLRTQVSSHMFLNVLQSRDRWHLLLDHIIESAEDEKISPYKVKYCKDLTKRHITTLLFENPGVFDWLV
jgi:hypothetical protein